MLHRPFLNAVYVFAERSRNLSSEVSTAMSTKKKCRRVTKCGASLVVSQDQAGTTQTSPSLGPAQVAFGIGSSEGLSFLSPVGGGDAEAERVALFGVVDCDCNCDCGFCWLLKDWKRAPKYPVEAAREGMPGRWSCASLLLTWFNLSACSFAFAASSAALRFAASHSAARSS